MNYKKWHNAPLKIAIVKDHIKYIENTESRDKNIVLALICVQLHWPACYIKWYVKQRLNAKLFMKNVSYFVLSEWGMDEFAGYHQFWQQHCLSQCQNIISSWCRDDAAERW